MTPNLLRYDYPCFGSRDSGRGGAEEFFGGGGGGLGGPALFGVGGAGAAAVAALEPEFVGCAGEEGELRRHHQGERPAFPHQEQLGDSAGGLPPQLQPGGRGRESGGGEGARGRCPDGGAGDAGGGQGAAAHEAEDKKRHPGPHSRNRSTAAKPPCEKRAYREKRPDPPQTPPPCQARLPETFPATIDIPRHPATPQPHVPDPPKNLPVVYKQVRRQFTSTELQMKKNIAFALLLTLVSCNKQPSTDSSGSPSAPAQAKPFKGEIYRTADDQQIITLVSPDELELRVGGTNLICKYTKQDDTLRVVANIVGTTQALYYRITPQGLQSNDGTILLAPQQHAQMIDAMRLARQREEEERQRIADEVAQARQDTPDVATFSLIPIDMLGSHSSSPDQITITGNAIKLRYPKGQPTEVGHFADFHTLRAIKLFENKPSFYIGWGGLGGTGNFLACATNTDVERVRGTLVKAFGEWSQKFPHAVPKIDIEP